MVSAMDTVPIEGGDRWQLVQTRLPWLPDGESGLW